MDNIRLILFFALAFIGLMLYQAWIEDYATPQVSDLQNDSAAESNTNQQNSAGVPTASVTPNTDGLGTGSVPLTAEVPVSEGTIIKVETDLLRVEISSLGGTLQRAFLLDYPLEITRPDIKFELLSPNMPHFYVAQSGLIGSADSSAPTHEAEYQFDRTEYQLTQDQDELVVKLVWNSELGVQVTKSYTFHRGSYLIDVKHEINNQSGTIWAARDYAQLQRTQPESRSGFTTYTYTGGVYYTPQDKYEKIDFDEMAEKQLNVDSAHGWFAMIQHYFVSAWIPPSDQIDHYYTNSLDGQKYMIGSYSPAITVADGLSGQFSRQLYIGPKLQDELEAIAEGLELTVDYGWLTVLAKPIFWLLKTIHDYIGNWGWSIIILTIIIKAAFYKLSETSYKSMANMRKVTPRLQALKDRFGDDKQRLNQAMMEMYKKEKINPLGGCLPILVQMPVFIALYWVLLESVELRQAPFILWIDNLSAKDPYFILPLIMGVSMFIQQKLNPAPPDPMQAKIMMSLPFVFTVFFAFFPAGLVLYWVVNNLISIVQQWFITRRIEQAGN